MAPVKKTRKTIAPSTGPVTLTEAKAIAKARLATRPKHAKAIARKHIAPRATNASVGEEREKLRQQQREEIALREREYKATMAVMKKRGARKPRPKGPPRKRVKAARVTQAFAPLQIFAEGDSWFDYPVPFFGGGIIPRLEERLGVPILNLAKAGDEVRYMLGVEERILLTTHLTDGCPAGGPWDVLLFSGGGNDIVDNPMALWVRDWDPAASPAAHLHEARFNTALALVQAGYEDLIAIRDRLSPSTHLVFHAYDFPIPDGRGICHLGPWLKPTFDLRGFPNRPAAFEVVQEMLRRFAAMLLALEGANSRITFINAQSTLAAQPSSWHNELHPAKRGFEQFAEIFYQRIKVLFPARVA